MKKVFQFREYDLNAQREWNIIPALVRLALTVGIIVIPVVGWFVVHTFQKVPFLAYAVGAILAAYIPLALTPRSPVVKLDYAGRCVKFTPGRAVNRALFIRSLINVVAFVLITALFLTVNADTFFRGGAQ